jgi:hypothetical protein
MSKPRSASTGVVAVLAIVLIASLGGLMMRARDGGMPDAARGVPPSATPPAAPRRAGTGTAKLRWVPPEPAGQDGSGTADPIAGYRVYVGTSPDDLRLEASIDDPTATSYVVERLPKGTFYYSVTTYTRRGVESKRPAPVSNTIE